MLVFTDQTNSGLVCGMGLGRRWGSLGAILETGYQNYFDLLVINDTIYHLTSSKKKFFSFLILSHTIVNGHLWGNYHVVPRLSEAFGYILSFIKCHNLFKSRLDFFFFF